MMYSLLFFSSAAAAAAAASSPASPSTCLEVAEGLCTADPTCLAFGLYQTQIQLHGCSDALVPNSNWVLYSRPSNTSTTYTPIPGSHNIDETQCKTHPTSGMQHECPPGPPPPPPGPPLYTKVGAVDVGTYENTIFYWQGVVMNIENIPCSYTEHAGIWEPEVFGNHSYARLRDFNTGRVIVNITQTVGFGFLTAFTDYATGTLWLFGTPADRCQGNGDATTVQAWWSKDPTLQAWSTALAYDYGHHTYNVQVSKVGPPGGMGEGEAGALAATIKAATAAAGLPAHNYVMMLEEFSWAINAGDGSDLTTGWVLLNGTNPPPGAPSGGPMIVFNPYDQYYYILTGGNTVHLYRTVDFVTWVQSTPSPFIFPSSEDALVSPYSGFPQAATRKGSPPNYNSHVGAPEPFPSRPFSPYWMGPNWTAWSRNSNDGDMCCMHEGVGNASWVVWGASTQGRPPGPPLDGTDAGTNSVAKADMPLYALLAAYFP